MNFKEFPIRYLHLSGLSFIPRVMNKCSVSRDIGRQSGSIDGKRRKLLALIGGSLSVGAAGCSGAEEAEEGEPDSDVEADPDSDLPNLEGQSITYITDESGDNAQEWYNALSAEFTQGTGAPINIEYTGQGLQSDQRIIQLLQAGNPPEVYLADTAIAAGLADAGVLAPLDDIVEPLVDMWGEPSSGYIQLDGTYFGAPKQVQPGCVFYRSDVSDIEPNTVDSMREYVEDVDANLDQFDDLNNATHIPAGTGEHNNVHLLQWAWIHGAYGVGFVDGELRSTIAEGENRERWIETLEFLDEMYEYSAGNTDATWNTQHAALSSGSGAIAWSTGSRAIDFSIDAEADFAADVMLPETGMVEGVNSISRDGGNTLIVFEDADVEAAKAFLEYFYQPDRFIDHFFHMEPLATTIVPPFEELRNDATYLDRVTEETAPAWTDEKLETYMAAADEAVAWPAEPSMDFAGSGPPNPTTTALALGNYFATLAQEVLINDMDPGDALDQMQPQINETIEDALEEGAI